jgi:SRSO17 transposase
MPNGIVRETCPAPGCNLVKSDIEDLMDELDAYVKEFEGAFRRVEQLDWCGSYLQGLLGEAPRKNVEQVALEQGQTVRSMRHFVGQSPWKEEPVIGIHQRLVGESLGEADGVCLVDESSVVKQGDDSVGVASQYCGCVGKTANGYQAENRKGE